LQQQPLLQRLLDEYGPSAARLDWLSLRILQDGKSFGILQNAKPALTWHGIINIRNFEQRLAKDFRKTEVRLNLEQ